MSAPFTPGGGPSPEEFARGVPVRLRDEPARSGVVVREGDFPDEWLVAFVDGERNVYLSEHLEPFAPAQNVAARLRLLLASA